MDKNGTIGHSKVYMVFISKTIHLAHYIFLQTLIQRFHPELHSSSHPFLPISAYHHCLPPTTFWYFHYNILPTSTWMVKFFSLQWLLQVPLIHTIKYDTRIKDWATRILELSIVHLIFYQTWLNWLFGHYRTSKLLLNKKNHKQKKRYMNMQFQTIIHTKYHVLCSLVFVEVILEKFQIGN